MNRYPPPYPPPLPLAVVSPLVDVNGLVVGDLACRRCAYNLRTLSLGGRCPECGLSVGFSAQGDRLCFSDPAWVLNVRRGALFILAGIGVIIAGIVLAIAVVLVEGEDRDISGVISSVAGLAGYVLYFVGAWLMTMPDPSGLGEDRYGTSRKLIRVTLLMGAVGQVIELVEAGLVIAHSIHVVFRIVAVVSGLSGLIGSFAQLHYIAKLAARVPDEHMVARAKFLKWALVGSVGLLFVGGFCAALLLGVGGAPGGALGAGCLLLILLVALLVFFVMYLMLLFRLSRVLKEQADYAQTTWAAGAAAPAQ